MTGNILIHGGPILTMNKNQPQADAVGIINGRVRAVGNFADVKSEMGSTFDAIDLNGRMATPGLYDAHAHIIGTGVAASEIEINADRVSSVEEIVQLVKARAQDSADDAWVIGQGYDQELLNERRHPDRADLDAVAPNQPVILHRTCHHIMVANSKALELAGITANSPDPD